MTTSADAHWRVPLFDPDLGPAEEQALVDVVLDVPDGLREEVRDTAGERGERRAHADQWRTLAKMSSRVKSGRKPVVRSKRLPSTVQGYLRKSIAPVGVW